MQRQKIALQKLAFLFAAISIIVHGAFYYTMSQWLNIAIFF